MAPRIPLLALLVGACHAFSAGRPQRPLPPSLRPSATTGSSHQTALSAKRRGRLANNVSLDEDGGVRLMSNKQKQKLGSSRGRKGKRGGGGGEEAAISPLLAEWAKEDTTEEGAATVASAATTSVATPSAAASDVFVPFEEEKSGKKGSKKSKRRSSGGAALSPAQSAQLDDLLAGIDEMLQTTNCDVSELVAQIASLVDLGASFSGNDRVLLPTLKSILSKRPGKDEPRPAYRLAWVGSDDAICHVGTALHKVPLARLQEIFLLLGYGRWELLEVIRILGPFPNVRNTLKGELKVSKLNGTTREGARLEVAYNSMIDGTGKEILAGKDDNVKVVNLDVWFADERAIVCTMPSEDDESMGGDPLKGDGSNILLFVKEENVDEELEKLRAA
ncbi:hypothetical protein ACHAXT_010956 [Thalassiosira profunda]